MNVAMREVRYCPVTGNQPLTCSRKGFAASCRKFQEQAALKKNRMATYCRICRGASVPKNVTFVEVAELQNNRNREETMATDRGACESCGKECVRKSHISKMVCSTCQVVRIAAKNNPATVLAALQEFGNMPDPAVDVVPDAEVEALREKLTAAKQELVEVAEALGKTDNETIGLVWLAKERMALIKRLDEAWKGEEVAKLAAEKKVEQLKEQLDYLESTTIVSSRPSIKSNGNGTAPGGRLPDIFWQMLERRLEQKISGLTIDDFREIAGLVKADGVSSC